MLQCAVGAGDSSSRAVFCGSVRCSVLQSVAACYRVLATRVRALYFAVVRVAVCCRCCSVLQCVVGVALCFSVLQCVAVCCSVLHYFVNVLQCSSVWKVFARDTLR